MMKMSKFIILRDTRQQKENHIIKEFTKQDILNIQTKLESADYMAIRHDDNKGFYKDYSTLIDTKKDLLEVCLNLCHTSEHNRVVREIELAKKLGCENFIFLVGANVKNANDIKNWSSKYTKVKGETLYKIIKTFGEHHQCKFIFVPKKDIGKTIVSILTKK